MLDTSHTSVEHREHAAVPAGVLFGAFCALVFLRFGLNANILDGIVNYSTDGGSILEKVHPSSYGILALLIATLLSQRIELDHWQFRAVRALMMLAAVTAMIMTFAILLGHSGSTGYLIDSYLSACAGGTLMLFFPRQWRERLGGALLIYIAASALVALVEFALQKRLLPYPLQELSFRPTGLTEHPLVLGLFNAVGINFVAATRWKPAIKAGVIALMLMGAVTSGARFASIVAGLSALSVIVLHEWPSTPRAVRLRMKSLLLLLTGLSIPIVVAVLASLGFLNRFQNGLLDENAMARIDIYRLFDLVGWSDILFGTDIEMVRRLALERFDLQSIESTIVMFVFQFGLIGTIIFIAALARTAFVLASGAGRHVIVGTFAFFIVAGSNNSLSTKTPTVMMLFLLIIAFHGARRAITVPYSSALRPRARIDTGSSVSAPSV